MGKKFSGMLVALMAVAMIATTSQKAEATAALFLTDGATSVVVADNGVGDLNPLAGVVTWSGALGVWAVNVTTGLTTPVTALPEVMHLNSVDVSTAAGSLLLAFTNTDFDLLTQSMTMALGPLLAPGGSITYQAYYDNMNAFFGTGGLIGTLNGAGSISGLVSLLSPYSLSQFVLLTHTGAGTSSFDANITVPEPATTALFGLALFGVGMVARRRFALQS